MKEKYHHKSRRNQLLISLGILSFIAWWTIVPIPGTILAIAVGMALGCLLGFIDWRKARARIDPRNVVIIYDTDSVLFSILAILFIVQSVPKLWFSAGKFLITETLMVEYGIVAIAAVWTGHCLAFWRGARKYEITHGRLITRRFWSRSVVGAEGMISKEGIVIETCDPSGRVRIESVNWKAESVDKSAIPIDKKVIVRDIEGLTLFVEELP